MTINRLLAKTTVGPEEIRLLNEAYKRALRGLHLVDRNDPLTEMVAKKIIEVNQGGINDPAQISQRWTSERQAVPESKWPGGSDAVRPFLDQGLNTLERARRLRSSI